jgi:hypothetical protein
MVDDKIFVNLEQWNFRVTKEDIGLFNSAMENPSLPESFAFETEDAYFKIDKVNKVFRILRRKEKSTKEAQHHSDMNVMVLYKIAKRSGYKCYLENKYMN